MDILSTLSNWYFSRKALPYWGILLLDCTIVLFAGFMAFFLSYEEDIFSHAFLPVTWGVLLTVLIYGISFRFFHTYTGIVRFSSFVDLYHVATANAVALVATILVGFVVNSVEQPYIDCPTLLGGVIIFVIATLLMWVERVAVKGMYDVFRQDVNTKRVFIYGVQAGGVSLANSIQNQNPLIYKVAGFISPDKQHSEYLMGEHVYLDDDKIAGLMKARGVEILIVSPLQSEHFRSRQELISQLFAANIKIMMMPAAKEWTDQNSLSHRELREVEIEDLLPRKKIEIDMQAIGDMLAGRRILITGAAGSIGSEMSRQVAKFGPAELILVDQAETPMHDMRLYMMQNHTGLGVWTIVGSITNPVQMEEIFSRHKPEFVFHAAAYKHVPMMEDNPGMAVQNNVYGTRVIADLAVKYGTKKFVMISTDKAVNPTNVMGCSKRICEIYCQSRNAEILRIRKNKSKGDAGEDEKVALRQHDGSLPATQFITTRFGNVLGSNGSVIPIFKEQIKKGGPITVTHPDIIRFFMLISEACRLVLEAGTMGKGGEIFVFDMGEPVRIADLAQRMIELSHAKDVKIVYTGLREGEKLYEEVLNNEERTKPTCHPKIKVAAVREYPYNLALKNEMDLYAVSQTFDDIAIVRKMKEIVPEYKSQNSKYAELDK